MMTINNLLREQWIGLVARMQSAWSWWKSPPQEGTMHATAKRFCVSWISILSAVLGGWCDNPKGANVMCAQLKKLCGLCLALVVLGLTGCAGPYQEAKFVEVKPNETAFVIPLEGDTKEGQAKLNSVDFLEKAKVAAKRVYITQKQHNTGRGAGSFKWIPTVEVIAVDRAPVSREWTADKESGTSARNQAVAVESLDSINFRVGVAITCSIREEDTAKFLYYFAGKKTDELMDKDVRNLVQITLAREFGKYPLLECPSKKNDVFKVCKEETTAFFKTKGLTVDALGNSEGLLFDNKEIQDQFNRQVVAENDIKLAKQEKLAQDERNLTMMAKKKAEAEATIEVAKQEAKAQEERNKVVISKAKAEREAAEELFKAKDVISLKVDMEVRRILADAQKTAAERWQGGVPASILPQGSGFLFNLDMPKEGQPAQKK